MTAMDDHRPAHAPERPTRWRLLKHLGLRLEQQDLRRAWQDHLAVGGRGSEWTQLGEQRYREHVRRFGQYA